MIIRVMRIKERGRERCKVYICENYNVKISLLPHIYQETETAFLDIFTLKYEKNA